MDIIHVEREKGITRCLMKAIPLRIAALDSDKCYQYLINHPSDDVVKLIKTIHVAANHVDNGWQCEMIKSTMNVGLAVCCRYDKYTKILSKILTDTYGYDVNIEKHKSFNALEKAMLNILLKASNKMMKQKTIPSDNMHRLLSDCSNDAVSFLHSIATSSLKDELDYEEYSRNITLVDFLLYTLYQDTAYRDIFFWLLNEVGRPEICNVIVKYVKDPKDWYVNIWFNSKKISKKQRDSGAIPRYEQCVIERRMVPTKQKYELNRLIKGK